MSMSVCSLAARISQKPHCQTSLIFVHVIMHVDYGRFLILLW